MTEAGYARILLDKKDTQIMKLESEITKLRIEYERQIKKMLKENAELKVKYDTCLRENTGLKIHSACVEKKLTEAKELLREMIDTPVFNQMGDELYENEGYTELVEEVEQFLKGEEK